DTELFSLLQEQLLVNQVAQHILLLVGKCTVRIARPLLLDFLLQLVAAAHIFGTRDDLVVYPHNDFFHHCIGGQQCRKQHRESYRHKWNSYLFHGGSLKTRDKPGSIFVLFYSELLSRPIRSRRECSSGPSPNERSFRNRRLIGPH